MVAKGCRSSPVVVIVVFGFCMSSLCNRFIIDYNIRKIFPALSVAAKVGGDLCLICA